MKKGEGARDMILQFYHDSIKMLERNKLEYENTKPLGRFSLSGE